jgi:hypothetical protein
MDAQWMLNGCSMDAQWMLNGCSMVALTTVTTLKFQNYTEKTISLPEFSNSLQRYNFFLNYANFFVQKMKNLDNYNKW